MAVFLEEKRREQFGFVVDLQEKCSRAGGGRAVRAGRLLTHRMRQRRDEWGTRGIVYLSPYAQRTPSEPF
jgi:hypothetical protein